MERKDIIINSKCDELPISVTMFIPDGEVKGIFQISHGMSEHKKRYYAFMEYLTKQGYVTVINDHRGHGKSVKLKDDLGYFYDKNAQYIVEDLHQITLYIKSLYPDVKVILFGHSMGSMVVRKYIKKYDKDIDNLIVCGAPSKNIFANLGIILVKLMKIFKGDKYRSNFVQNMTFGNYNKHIKTSKSDNAWICTSEDTIKSYNTDELCGFIFTLNGFENLFKLMKHIYQKDGWSINNKNLPIFFIAGSNDPVIMSEKKWKESQEFLRKIGYLNVQGKLYENLRHEILNEKNKIEIYQDIIKFITD